MLNRVPAVLIMLKGIKPASCANDKRQGLPCLKLSLILVHHVVRPLHCVV